MSTRQGTTYASTRIYASTGSNHVTSTLRQCLRVRLIGFIGALLMMTGAGALNAAGASATTVRAGSSARASVSRSAARRPASILWGAVIGSQFTGQASPYDMGAVRDFVSQDAGGKGPSIIPMYSPFLDCSASPCTPYAFPSPVFNTIRSYGSIPMISWSSADIQDGNYDGVTDPNFTLANVVAGKFDAYITQWAQAAKRWGHPFFLRFNWEMNGNWFVWGGDTNDNSPALSVAAWRHVHNIFTRVGATNANWVWCPNNGNQNGVISNLKSYYPGNAYVNWTCMDAYNWGSDSWNAIARPTYREITKIAPSKPFMVGEFNSGSDNGHQARWLANALSEIPSQYPKIHAIILFDAAGDTPWNFDSRAASEAFAQGIRRSVYARNAFRAVRGARIRTR